MPDLSDSSDPIIIISRRYLRILIRNFKDYWKLFAHPYNFGRDEMKLANVESELIKTVKGTVFWMTAAVASASTEYWLLNNITRIRELEPSLTFTQWWIIGALISAVFVPQAIILWLILRSMYKISLSMIIIFYAKILNVFFCAVAVFFFFIILFMSIPAIILYNPTNYDIETMGFVHGSILTPFFDFGMKIWFLFVLPQRFLSGWLQISYVRSIAYLFMAAFGAVPFVMVAHLLPDTVL